MNCCDAFGNCNQGRNCPARQPADPAKASQASQTTDASHATQTAARAMYSRCDILGVCQAQTPCAGHCELWARQVLARHDDAAVDANFDRADRRIGLLLTGVLALIVLSMLFGMASVYAGTIAAALDWAWLSVQLLLYRWGATWS